MVGTLKITRFNGIELFSISRAVIVIREGVNVEPDDDGEIDDELQGSLTLYIETDPKPIEYSTDDTIHRNPHPSVEIHILDEVRLASLVGREFSIENGALRTGSGEQICAPKSASGSYLMVAVTRGPGDGQRSSTKLDFERIQMIRLL